MDSFDTFRRIEPLTTSRRPIDRFAITCVLVTAAIWAALGAWLLIWPDRLPASFGVASSPAMRTEVRAFYGGLELGIAACLLILVRRDLFAAVVLGGVPLLAMGTTRLFGLVVDVFSTLHIVLITSEFLGGGLNLWAARGVGRRDSRSKIETSER